MHGLTTLSKGQDFESRPQISDQELCPFIMEETSTSVFQDPMDDVLWRAINAHLRCRHVSEMEHTAMEPKRWIFFHVVFYEILRSETASSDSVDLWPSGDLHSDMQQSHGRPRRIRESAFSVRLPCLIFVLMSH